MVDICGVDGGVGGPVELLIEGEADVPTEPGLTGPTVNPECPI